MLLRLTVKGQLRVQKLAGSLHIVRDQAQPYGVEVPGLGLRVPVVQLILLAPDCIVARRLAQAGLLAIAPDALSASGGTPQDEDLARKLIGELDREAALGVYLAAVRYSAKHRHGTGKVGCVGFCWGGGMAGRLAANSPELTAAVVFYGMPPAADEAARVHAPLLLNYAGLDTRINEAVPAFEAALRNAGRRYELYRYADVDHAFHNDTNAARYNAEAAALAWNRTVEFLSRELR